MSQFKKGCDYCPKQIIMKKDPSSNSWKAYETDGQTLHKCDRSQAYKDIPSNDIRDKSMAPITASVPIDDLPKLKDPSRAAWEKENKEIKASLELAKVWIDEPKSELQILMTELTKHTHLLSEINDNIIKLLKDKEDEKK